MGVLKDIESPMSQDEISRSEKDYLDETAHLRAAREAIARSLAQFVPDMKRERIRCVPGWQLLLQV
jgi:hypothetical protein